MMKDERANSEITALLHAHAAGDAAALDRLLPQVYNELRRIARQRLRRERENHTLAATELVHEAQPLDDLIAVSEALTRLERVDARQAQVVECRFLACPQSPENERDCLMPRNGRVSNGKRSAAAGTADHTEPLDVRGID
jgi:ECF sigma factor